MLVVPTSTPSTAKVAPADEPPADEPPARNGTIKAKRETAKPAAKKDKSLLSSLPTKKHIKNVLFRSPIGPLLLVCTFTFLWCVAEIVAPPPFGVNTGWSGGDACSGADFEPMPVCICPRETVCVKDVKSLIFLAFARLSAYFDYPLYVLLFLSKAHNLRGFLQRTYLSEFLPLDDLHHLHTFAGAIVGFEVIWHSFWHLLRWGLGGDIRLLWEHITGISGLISLLVTPLIAWPMYFTRLRKGIEFRARKWLHYLSLVWGVAICFHAPVRWIGPIMGIAVGVYAADWIYGYFFKITLAPTLKFTRIGNAVEVVWEHPKGFHSDGAGYVYICLPWVSKTEWHAFSLVSHPKLPNHSCVCMAAVGDWTKKVHAALAKPSSRPGWLYGPFPSPFSTATGYDNLVAVASGIGITPSISAIVNLSASRKVHLIWMCRDADLVEFYLRNVTLDDDAWSFIFYTGKRQLVLGQKPANPKIKVCFGRPNLEQLILALVDNTNNGTPLPKKVMDQAREAEAKIYEKSPTERFCDALERGMTSYSTTEMFSMALSHTEADAGKPPESVSLKGFIAMVRTVCNIEGGLSDAELEMHFRTVDTSGNGGLDPTEVAQIVESLRKAAANESQVPTTKVAESEVGVIQRQSTSLKEARSAELKAMVSSWQIMYCGGAAPVVQSLNEVHQKYDIPVKIESFAW